MTEKSAGRMGMESEKAETLIQRTYRNISDSLQFIFANSDKFANPEFNNRDFYHGHLIKRGDSLLLLYHTKESTSDQNEHRTERNIIFEMDAGNLPSTRTPRYGEITVQPSDLSFTDKFGVVLVQAVQLTSFYFAKNKKDLQELLDAAGIKKNDCEIRRISLERFGSRAELLLAIPKELGTSPARKATDETARAD